MRAQPGKYGDRAEGVQARHLEVCDVAHSADDDHGEHDGRERLQGAVGQYEAGLGVAVGPRHQPVRRARVEEDPVRKRQH
eukprot:CAMPEP_0181237130 /NCGR_PEP_ID=MMETSP1096-20121128/38584_1 /TAXON_ID=156174 ORGANISM="Chrysochromulina ericina, Strain CCMP281" /NCGR_SAMPLE_ID=MMETSP1096 /ASSEMBLY_ACC=CAM_ASM_000453 /LENGTH=79 /DNA_ID=CAMNT_0023332435 /DNA_START=1032 /DNA_END=1267 /DNA_ORIENTATION=+